MATKRSTKSGLASEPATKRVTRVTKQAAAGTVPATAPADSTAPTAPTAKRTAAPAARPVARQTAKPAGSLNQTSTKAARKAAPAVKKSAKKTARRVAAAGETEPANAAAAPVIAPQTPRPGTLEARIGYRFRDPSLLALAMTHSSFVYEGRPNGLAISAESSPTARLRAQEKARSGNEPGTDNEQLELLGDAVVGLLVTELLLIAFPDRSEGELTRMRSTLVSRRRMSLTGDELKLGEELRLGPTAEASGARQSTGMLANATEALLAAMYLDAQRAGEDGLALTRGLVDRMLVQPDLPSLRSAVAASSGRDALRDSKSTLQERVQAVSAGQLRYADVEETGPAHDRRFTVQVELSRNGRTRVLAKATGRSKKEAQQSAAADALAGWKADPWQGPGAE